MRGWSWELSLSSRRSVWLGTARGGCLEKVGWESSRGKHTIRRGRREQARFSACFRKNVYDLRLEFFLFLPSSVLLLIKSPRETVTILRGHQEQAPGICWAPEPFKPGRRASGGGTGMCRRPFVRSSKGCFAPLGVWKETMSPVLL